MFGQSHSFVLKLFFINFLLVITTAALAQSPKTKPNMSVLKKDFASFEYKKVVQLADTLLQKRGQLKEADVLEILRMKAIAYYVLDQNEMATLTFIEILKLKPDYQLDPLNNSPKIIRFFETIKKNYLKNQTPKSIVRRAPKAKNSSENLGHVRSTIYKSVLWPGLGHYSAGEKGKGAFLMITSLFGASASGYLIWRTNMLEERYLNAVDQADIDHKYKAYNKTYRWRNAALISYGVIWLYAQFDLSMKLFKTERLTLHLQSLPSLHRQYGLSLRYRF